VVTAKEQERSLLNLDGPRWSPFFLAVTLG